jgi:hypothetical protein
MTWSWTTHTILVNKSTDSNSSTGGRGGVEGLIYACYGTDIGRDSILAALSTNPEIVKEAVNLEGGISTPSGCVKLVADKESGEWKGFGR